MEFYKPVQSQINVKKETSTVKRLTSSELLLTKCDRTDTGSAEANYFSSFNLPASFSDFLSGGTLALNSPELLQLNVDKIVIIPIPESQYNEIIDGRSIILHVPQSGTTSGLTIVSSTYSVLGKKQSSPLLGENISFLFSDTINLPFSGTVGGNLTTLSNRTTWYVEGLGGNYSYVHRPYAIAWEDLEHSGQNDDRNSDGRAWSTVKTTYPVEENYPEQFGTGYNYDIPVGFVCLDKGFIVLTHKKIVDDIPWGYGCQGYYDSNGDVAATFGLVGNSTTNVAFTATTYAVQTTLQFYDIDTQFKNSVVCLALPGEFFMSTNATWNIAKNIQEQENQSNNYDSIYATEIGLYNKNKEMIAIAKLSEPVEKSYTNIITFNLDIEV